MKPVLKGFRLAATALAACIMLVGASPNFVVFAQTVPSAATSVALTEPTIKALQEALNKQGIAVKVDGVLNDETRAAIRNYQSQHHVPVTGEPDKATLDKLGVRQSAAPGQAPVLAQATPTSPAGSPSVPAQNPTSPAPDASTQPGQMPASTATNCPMMQGQMQGMMQMMQGMQGTMRMMQGQTQPGQTQPAQMPGSATMSCPMMQGQMQAMMQMMQGMQGMMQMMQGQMQPGQMQPGQMQPPPR